MLYERTVHVSYTRISDIIKYNTFCNKNIKKNSELKEIEILLGITILNQKIIYKDDITIVTEFPCLLALPVSLQSDVVKL